MPLSPQDIEGLKHIWKDISGEDISDDEAWAMATRVLTVFEVLGRTIADSQAVDATHLTERSDDGV